MKKKVLFFLVFFLVLSSISYFTIKNSDYNKISGNAAYGSYGSYGCTNECSQGSRQCSGAYGYLGCGNYDVDSCFEWSNKNNCPSSQTCSNGYCVCTPNWQCTSWGQCVNNVQTRKCTDINNCPILNDNTVTSAAISTKPSETQSCVINSCANECPQNGIRQCFGNGYKICGNYDYDSCLEWSSLNDCPQDQACSNGICSLQNLNQNKCLDNTELNKCSASKPKFCEAGNLISKCSLCGCPNNGECLIDGSCASKVNGTQYSNLNLINKAPTFSFIPEIIIDQNKQNFDNLINLNNYAKDPENENINFEFENQRLNFESETIDCFIKENMLGCNQPKKDGQLKINIIAKDSFKSASSEISLKIIPSFKISENKAPIAEAGGDKTTIAGSFVILDASKSYDSEDNLPNSPSNYIWYENGKEIGQGINLKKEFPQGEHKITLQVIDSEGLSSTDSIIISVKSKNRCRDTSSVYFPEDTICNQKWPSQEGELLNINSKGYSCNLVEVCSEDLDFIIEDAINCCDGTPLIDNQGKNNACSFANKYSGQNTKKCQALYLVNSLGGNGVYMKDYFEAEMCCKGVNELCSDQRNLYSARPLPRTGKDLSGLRCNNNPNNNPPGDWASDSKLDLNNIALQDLPAHVSLNVLSSGTCVDYSFALTTLIRKAGYGKDEVYTVEAPNHAYNLIKLPLDKKYTLVDTTGNNNPAIIFGKEPLGYKYCENIQKCYNDNGQTECPDLKEVYGCENVQQNLAQKTTAIGLQTNKIFDKLKNFVKAGLE